jgi:signal transduction histidine kinase
VQVGEALPEPALGWSRQIGVHEHHEAGLDHEVRAVPFGSAGVIVVVSDVTDQRRALERAARSERLALVGQMLAQITHEVRNPLNAISLNAEMLGDEIDRLDPEQRTEAGLLLGTISSEIERLVAVTAHYLQLARRPRARLVSEDLGELVGDVARLLHAELGQAGVALEVRAEALPAQLVDGNQLRQALLNVVRNAVEAGARRLRIEVGSDEAEVRLALVDDGPGMTTEEVSRAFDPFYSTKATGTGLGLAITRQILEDHDGTVRVDSAPGSGTTVTLAWPRRDAPALDQARAR